MNQVLLAVLIDALRHDFITKKHTPFIYSLLREGGVLGELIPPFTFSFHPVWFAGLYPEESGQWLSPIFSPNTSPWRFISSLSFFTDRIPILRKFCNLSIAILNGVKETVATETPLEIARYFDYPVRKVPWSVNYVPGHKTLFDIMRENNMKWLYIGYPPDRTSTAYVYKKFRKRINREFSFIWLHFGDVDRMGHKFGPLSYKVSQELRQIDRIIGKILDILESLFDEIDIVIFGDHGMVEVKKTIDIMSLFRNSKLKLHKDFIYFLGATTARFWFKNETSKNIAKNILCNIPEGFILDENWLRKLRCRFFNREYGDLIFAMKGGAIICPNFFNGNKPPKGMHGYLPCVKDNHAAIVVYGAKAWRLPKEFILETPQVFNIMLNALNLKYQKS